MQFLSNSWNLQITFKHNLRKNPLTWSWNTKCLNEDKTENCYPSDQYYSGWEVRKEGKPLNIESTVHRFQYNATVVNNLKFKYSYWVTVSVTAMLTCSCRSLNKPWHLFDWNDLFFWVFFFDYWKLTRN